MALQRKTQKLGYMLVRVTGCRPETTYYYRLSFLAAGIAARSSIRLPARCPASRQKRKIRSWWMTNCSCSSSADSTAYGRIVTLSNANASYCLAGVIGDGADTNQVFFNASELF